MKRALDKEVKMFYDGSVLTIRAIDFKGVSQGCMRFIGESFDEEHGRRNFSMNVVYEEPEMSKIKYTEMFE